MSELVLVSDIHANAPALDAVIEREGREAEYIVLGDLMGLNGYPEGTLYLLQSFGDIVLAGNHDRAIFHYDEGHVNSAKLSEFELQHTLSELSEEQQAWVRERTFMDVLTRSGERIAAAHAYPWPEKASGYEPGNAGVSKADVPHVASVVSDDYDWVFTGHTHEQYSLDCKRFGHDVTFVNPGSLGYDSTYSVVDIESGDVKHKSVEGEYDHENLKEHVQSQLPDNAPPVDEWL